MNLVNRGTYWTVGYLRGNEAINERFNTVDEACDFLEDVLFIDGGEVDEAVINLSATKNNVAVFDTNGLFNHSTLN